MTQRSALVTGASRGIGLEVARLLASEGYGLTLVARGADGLADAAAALSEHEVPVEVLSANVADDADVARVVDAHHAAFGGLDVLVNSAGMGVPAPLAVQTLKQIDLQIAVNLRSVMAMCRAAQPLLEKSAAVAGRSLVVNLASISGKVGSASLSVYSATKHGIVGFTDAMNREMYTSGVRYVALCPGFVDTSLSDYVKEHLAASEMIHVSDIAESVRFLLRLSPACLVPEIVFMEAAALGIRPLQSS